ncbi:glycosyltransferase family 87 protein [Herbidospora mongoliensis]|uniref:glycosyltransferase family 87 protein n=1 Tax=Herbidospora mongoliensis TaxID=688067 RepID=UPI00083090D3|nr:glycosyltransferase family 87 protein [Herbidospora mongoliensis]
MRYAAPVWLLTRVLIFLAAMQIIPVGFPMSFENDIRLYSDWSDILLTGQFPDNDEKWQYPPFAAVPMLLPHLLPFLDYLVSFFVIAILCDLGILLLIWRFCRRTGGGLGAVWAWVFGPILLGPLLIARYDLMVAIFAMAALTASVDPAVRGAFIGIGFSIKVWPIALLAGMRRWRDLFTGGLSALAATVVACGATALVMPNALDFLTAQQERGLQVESMAATPFVLLRALGLWDGFSTYQHGAMELAGTGVETATRLAVLATPIAAGLLLVWWLRAHPTEATFYDAALTTVLFLVLTSRVLSPQYMIWLIGLAAVVFSVPGSSQKPVAWLLLAATLLTGITYPWVEEHYSWKGELPGTLVLAARNAVLLIAAVVSFRRLWTSTRRPVEDADGRELEAVPTS